MHSPPLSPHRGALDPYRQVTELDLVTIRRLTFRKNQELVASVVQRGTRNFGGMGAMVDIGNGVLGEIFSRQSRFRGIPLIPRLSVKVRITKITQVGRRTHFRLRLLEILDATLIPRQLVRLTKAEVSKPRQFTFQHGITSHAGVVTLEDYLGQETTQVLTRLLTESSRQLCITREEDFLPIVQVAFPQLPDLDPVFCEKAFLDALPGLHSVIIQHQSYIATGSSRVRVRTFWNNGFFNTRVESPRGVPNALLIFRDGPISDTIDYAAAGLFKVSSDNIAGAEGLVKEGLFRFSLDMEGLGRNFTDWDLLVALTRACFFAKRIGY